ncbi:MAG: bifunctional biotin--[acetyl-CoA-carboxylase] ligase/biotin operon repressor BirA [Porticoccaceae bacterium]|nr:bifunctional biotin--[acetyl-CoA-carboxylase] ligase/biotin operon repressor BirA [Porticoccaceae bacterium]
MSIKSELLNILNDGEFHSGEDLGQVLGVSRTAVWKQLQALEAMGLQLESVKGKGYKIPNNFELLSHDQINLNINKQARSQLNRLDIYQTLDSTNKVANQLVQEQSDTVSGTVILSEYQTMGRGRRGKNWVSPFAANLYLSMVWDFDQGASALQGLSLAIGVAVSRALKQLKIEGVKLKWPNDIYINHKKLGGILLEMIGDPAGQCSVIIGIGINHCMPEKNGQDIDQEWTDLASITTQPVSRNRLAAYIINHCFDVLGDYQKKGFSDYKDEWQEIDAFKGIQAVVSTVNQSTIGTPVGVDEYGALKMKLASGEIKSFIGGELSLRPFKK